ncbi:hypothetical protein [Desulfonatronum thioautotrophicum]|uniref:hypothetical protein n=1 Tax=Desulfonatronum thioautotrophicum TaxID=617001 RepID=UPI0012947AB2|nr:hypothetical protein [Desulfonatronum thioautotrophicum]
MYQAIVIIFSIHYSKNWPKIAMARKTMQKIPLSRLKGINIYINDDLYNIARMNLELSDARAKYENSTSIRRPTMHGLVNIFARFIDVCHPDIERVMAAIKGHNFPMNAPIEFDENCHQEHEDTASGQVFHIRSHAFSKK